MTKNDIKRLIVLFAIIINAASTVSMAYDKIKSSKLIKLLSLGSAAYMSLFIFLNTFTERKIRRK